jgi:hypothetical protein
MENMEVGHTMSSRYDYISNIVEANFLELSRKISNLPKNIIQFIIQLF